MTTPCDVQAVVDVLRGMSWLLVIIGIQLSMILWIIWQLRWR